MSSSRTSKCQKTTLYYSIGVIHVVYLVYGRVIIEIVDDADSPHVVVLELGLDVVGVCLRPLMNHVAAQFGESIPVLIAQRVLQVDDVHSVEVRLGQRSIVLACDTCV